MHEILIGLVVSQLCTHSERNAVKLLKNAFHPATFSSACHFRLHHTSRIKSGAVIRNLIQMARHICIVPSGS